MLQNNLKHDFNNVLDKGTRAKTVLSAKTVSRCCLADFFIRPPCVSTTLATAVVSAGFCKGPMKVSRLFMSVDLEHPELRVVELRQSPGICQAKRWLLHALWPLEPGLSLSPKT